MPVPFQGRRGVGTLLVLFLSAGICRGYVLKAHGLVQPLDWLTILTRYTAWTLHVFVRLLCRNLLCRNYLDLGSISAASTIFEKRKSLIDLGLALLYSESIANRRSPVRT